MSTPIFTCSFASEAETAAFAIRIAGLLRIGDTLLLNGDIGAGKTAFARALIRARLGRNEDVPSPTFTLVQTYDHPTGDIWHCDLYRLSHPDEALELGLEEAFETAICLIEWPDRLGQDAPDTALSLYFEARDDCHQATILGSANWAERLSDFHA